MGFIQKFLPGVAKRKTTVPVHPVDGEWRISWTRRNSIQNGGQNFSLSSQMLPRYSMSGPLRLNAKQFRPLEPAPAIDVRRIPTVTVTGRNTLTGQFFGQPLLDPETGGFTSAAVPMFARPYSINGVRPAGVA